MPVQNICSQRTILFKNPEYVDYAFVGYAEQTVVDILKGDESNVKEVNGIKWVVEKRKSKGAVVIKKKKNKWGRENVHSMG